MASPKVSVVVCTYNRPDSYAALLASLVRQTEVNYELITITERGSLAQLRNRGLSRAHGAVVAFLDDDVVCPNEWLAGVLEAFRTPTVNGVTGPAIITPYFRRHRDLFRYPGLKHFHDYLFTESQRPGVLSKAGTFNTLAAEEDCAYQGTVDYLEACNMSFRTEALRKIGGFDVAYGGIGDWSEPDACFRLRSTVGGKLWFTPRARLFHQPAIGGATLFRRGDARQRLANYSLFARRWVQPHWRHTLYRIFLTIYYTLQTVGLPPRPR